MLKVTRIFSHIKKFSTNMKIRHGEWLEKVRQQWHLTFLFLIAKAVYLDITFKFLL